MSTRCVGFPWYTVTAQLAADQRSVRLTIRVLRRRIGHSNRENQPQVRSRTVLCMRKLNSLQWRLYRHLTSSRNEWVSRPSTLMT
jgi:hypothetical protein